MKTVIKKRRIILITSLVLAFVFATTAYAGAAWYHGIYVTYYAWGQGHYGTKWYSAGGIDAGQNVDQIGRTYWSTLEYCGNDPIQSSFWQSNATITLSQNDHYATGRFIAHHGGCDPGKANRLRTYFHLYVQDAPYAGKEYKPTHYAYW